MSVVSISTGKGGVGKTSLAVNLAVGIARRWDEREEVGLEVMLIDLDPQGSSSEWLLGLERRSPMGSFHAIRDGRFQRLKHCVQIEGMPLWVSPATPELRTLDPLLSATTAGELALRKALSKMDQPPDVVIIDCPNGFGISVIAALCASEYVLAPFVPSVMSATGLRALEETMALVKEDLGAYCKLLGTVMVGSNERESVTADARARLRAHAGARLFKAEVRQNTRAKAMPGRGSTVWDPGDPKGLADYLALLKEMKKRMAAK